MAHRFDRSRSDPYSRTANVLAEHVFSSDTGIEAGGSEELYDALSNAVVTALGDIAATAFRNGLDDPHQLRGLARAIAHVCEDVIVGYAGEVDPEQAIRLIESDSRYESLVPENRDKLRREIEKTRQLELLILHARRLPDLFDFAGSLGLHVDESALEEGTLLVSTSPTPTAGTQTESNG
ncbi:MAG TPA: hypothetical protein VKX16_01510 [Chloroflexota bacterium]|nr:hypothetical protein [Chloroflexota bacterium]